jgi:hypothetical protein
MQIVVSVRALSFFLSIGTGTACGGCLVMRKYARMEHHYNRPARLSASHLSVSTIHESLERRLHD